MTYDALRHFADSWGLAFMVVLFLSFCWLGLSPRLPRCEQSRRQYDLRGR